MKNISGDSIAQLTDKPSFRAEVIGALVQESANLLAEYGIAGTNQLITNLYFIFLRDSKGDERLVQGMNATSRELRCIQRLEKGRTYTFPDALLERWPNGRTRA